MGDRTRFLALAALAAVMYVAATTAAEAAKPPAPPTAAVSLGDSYISGEAGRWQGNSIDALASRDGTDRAFTGTGYDLSQV